MNQKTSIKKAAKKFDLLTYELKKGFEWTTQHSKFTIVTSLIFIGVGLTYSVFQYYSDKQETEVQEQYFKVEREFLKKKDLFDRYEATSKQANEKPKDKKNKTKTQPQKIEGEKASGDFEKDYGFAANAFSDLILKNPNSKAAMMSALNLSEVQIKYKKDDEALALLNKIKTNRDVLSAMILIQKGTTQANLKDCKSAVDTWGQVLQMKTAQFMHADIRLRQAICFENLNDSVKAEESYNKVIAEVKDGAVAKTAEKYLRLLKAKAN